MSQKRINQLPDLTLAGDDNNDYLVVQKWEGQGQPNLSTNTGWKTYTARLGQYFSTFFGAINSLAVWIAAPISTDAGNTATLGSDNKIFVPAPQVDQDLKTIATQSSPVTIANTNVETIFPTNLPIVGADNLVGALYELHFNLSKGPAGHNSTIRVYINKHNNLTNQPVKVLEYGSGFNSNTSFPFMFRYFRNSVGLVVPRDVNAAATVLSNLTTQSLVSTIPINFSPQHTYYFVITTQMSVNNSAETLQFAKLCLTK